jgi:hypothetical protein
MESKAIVIREIDSTETFKRAAEPTVELALTQTATTVRLTCSMPNETCMWRPMRNGTSQPGNGELATRAPVLRERAGFA